MRQQPLPCITRPAIARELPLFNETLFRNMCGYKGHWGTLTQGLGFFLITSSFYLTLYTSNESARVGERERRGVIKYVAFPTSYSPTTPHPA